MKSTSFAKFLLNEIEDYAESALSPPPPASYGFCNKLPQTRWLKTIHFYCFIILEATIYKIKVSARPHSFWRLQGKIWFLVFPSFWKPPAFLGTWTLPNIIHFAIWASKYISPSLMLFCLPLSLKKTLVGPLGSTWEMKGNLSVSRSPI